MNTIYYVVFGLLATFVFAAVFGGSEPLDTVQTVDLKRYAGKWFEVARLPNSFEKNCAGNVTAEYAPLDDGKISVINRCSKAAGGEIIARGKARVKDRQTNAKLKVSFAPDFLSFLPFVWGDYWILELGENYEYAVVGDESREYFWILSRSPQLDDALMNEILQRFGKKGFDVKKIIKTKQGI